jgi:hypothetical protein
MQALKDDALGYIINDPRGKPTPAQNIAEEPERSTVYYGFSCYACLPSGAVPSGCWTLVPRDPLTVAAAACCSGPNTHADQPRCWLLAPSDPASPCMICRLHGMHSVANASTSECCHAGMSEPGGLGYGALGFQEKQARELATASGFSGFEVITDKFQSHLNNVFLLKP